MSKHGYDVIAARMKDLADHMSAQCPDSRVKTIALSDLRLVETWAKRRPGEVDAASVDAEVDQA